MDAVPTQVVKFPDVLSQMCDLLDKKEAVYCLDDFKRKREVRPADPRALLLLNRLLTFRRKAIYLRMARCGTYENKRTVKSFNAVVADAPQRVRPALVCDIHRQ